MTVMNSLDRMLRILDLFTEERLEWTSEQMITELGYSRPTLYRYIKTLRDKGLLTSANNACFTLGPKVVEMDYLMRKSDHLAQESKPILEDLAARHGATAFLSRWYRTQVLCVESVLSDESPTSSFERGRPMPIGRSATSRAILASLPTRQSDRIIEAEMDELIAIGFANNPEEAKANLKAIRKAGYAVAEGEITQGVVGFSSPIFDGGRIPVACVSMSLISDRVTPGRRPVLAAAIKSAAAELTARLIVISGKSTQ